jgi:hypothetical protein
MPAKKAPAKKPAAKKVKAKSKEKVLMPLADALDLLDSKPNIKVGRESWSEDVMISKQGAMYYIESDARGREPLLHFQRDMIEQDYFVVKQ